MPELIDDLLFSGAAAVAKYLVNKALSKPVASTPAVPDTSGQLNLIAANLSAMTTALTAMAQATEMIATRDEAVSINHNGPIFQVRSSEIIGP